MWVGDWVLAGMVWHVSSGWGDVTGVEAKELGVALAISWRNYFKTIILVSKPNHAISLIAHSIFLPGGLVNFDGGMFCSEHLSHVAIYIGDLLWV